MGMKLSKSLFLEAGPKFISKSLPFLTLSSKWSDKTISNAHRVINWGLQVHCRCTGMNKVAL